MAAIAALLWTGYEIYQQRELGAALKTPTAPRGIVSLELAPTASRASVIRADWNSRPSALVPGKTATYDAQQVRGAVEATGIQRDRRRHAARARPAAMENTSVDSQRVRSPVLRDRQDYRWSKRLEFRRLDPQHGNATE